MLDDATLYALFKSYEPVTDAHLPLAGPTVLLITTCAPKGFMGYQVIEALPNGPRAITRAGTGVVLPVDTAAGHVDGRPALVLTGATSRLRAYRNAEADACDDDLPLAKRQAVMLGVTYGKTYCLSDNVVQNMQAGQYVFITGASNHPKLQRFDPATRELDGAVLQRTPQGHLSKGRLPVFLLMDVTSRVAAQAQSNP